MSVQKSLVGVLVVLVIVAGVGGYFVGSSAVPPPKTITSVVTQTVTTTAAAATVTVTSTVTQPPRTITSTVTPPPTTVTVTVTPSPTPPPIAWPTRPVTIIVPTGPGGGTDTAARTIAPLLEKLTGFPWVVVNKEGGGGVVAETYLQEQPADGYHVLIDSPSLLMNIILNRLQYNLSNFVSVCRLQMDVTAIWIRADDKRFTNVEELIKYGKNNEILIGGTGIGRFDHIVAATFASYAGIKWSYIPFGGSSEMHLDLVAGKVDAIVEEPGIILSLYKEGRVRPIVFMEPNRLKDFPDVPAAAEIGVPKEILPMGTWRALWVKAGTPKEVIDKLAWLCARVYESPEYKEYEQRSYLFYKVGLATGYEFEQIVIKEYQFLDKLLTELGIKK